MTHRGWVALLGSIYLCACGGSGGGGGGGGATPIQLVNFQVAGDIIGQTTVTGNAPDNGATVNQIGVSNARGHLGNGSLYFADLSNHRILGWNSVPTGLGQPADFVLGQVDFITRTNATTASKFDTPASCWVASGTLFVADSGNNRVLLFGGPPTSNVAATVALGQPDLTTGNPLVTQNGLERPTDVCVAANRIVVVDRINNRVMVWSGIPATSGTNAQVVLGQPDFTTGSSGSGANKMNSPSGVWTDGTRLVVADTTNNRVLIWTTFPTSNGQSPDLVVGQPDLTTNTPGAGTQGLNGPYSVAFDGVQLFVVDNGNNRVLIYGAFPTANNPAAVGVLGQSNFTNVAPNDDDQNGLQDVASARTLNGPRGVTTLGNKLFVADDQNNRVLIFTGS